MPPLIEEDAILLPDFLFYFDDLKSKSISPAASFNPAASNGESGFQASSSPSNKPHKRTIVLDKSSVSNLEYGEQIALAKRLQLAGFSIFLCCWSKGSNIFCKLNDDLSNVKQLHSLANFVEADYLDLAKAGVAREQSVIMNRSDQGQMGAVKKAFSHTNYSGMISGNDWKCEMRVFLDDEIEEKVARVLDNKRMNKADQTWKEVLAFYLSKVTADQQSIIFKSCEDLEDEMIFFSAFFSVNFNIKNTDNSTSEDLKVLYRVLEKYVPTNRWDVVRKAKIFSDQDDKIIESYFTKACEKIDAESVIYDMIFLIKNFPNQKEKLVKILRKSHEFKKDILDEDEVQLQKFVLDIFEGRPDESTARYYDDTRYLSSINLALLAEGIVSEKLLNRMGSHYTSNILDWAKVFKYEVVEMLTNYSFNNFTDDDVRLKALALMTSIDSEKAEELIKKHKFNFASEVKLEEFIRKLAPEVRNRVSDLYPQYADYHLSVQDLLEMNHPENPSARPKMTYLTIPKLSYRVISEFMSETKPQEVVDAVVIDIIDDNVDNAILFLEIMDAGRKMRNITKKQKYLSNKIDDLKVTFNFKKKNLFTEIDEDNEVLKELWDKIEDAEAGLKSTVDETKELLPKINFNVRHLTLPKSLEKNIKVQEILKIFGDEISYEFVDRQNYLGIGDAVKNFEREKELKILRIENEIRRLLLLVGQSLGIENELSSEHLLSASISPLLPPTKNKIRVAKGGLSEKMTASTDVHSTYEMVSAGDVLNDDSFDPQIRTGIIKRDITTSLEQSKYVPSQFKEVEGVKLLTDEDVASFAKIDSTNGVYLQFTQTLTAGRKSRLFSADAAEELVGCKNRDVKIEKGDDDFFYATSECDCNFTYVIKAQRQISLDLPSDHPIKKIIDSYKNAAVGDQKIAEEYVEENHCQWLENRFNQRDGSCRHKVAAVEYQLQKADGVNQQDFRVVNINNNHVVLEIKCKDRWVQVDVGGGSNYTEKDAPESEVYQSEMVVPKQAVVKEEAKDLHYLLEEILNSDQESTTVASDNSEVDSEVDFFSEESDSDSEVEPSLNKDTVAQKVTPDKEELERKLMSDEESRTRLVRAEEARKLKQAKDAALKATLKKLIAVFDFPKIADQAELKFQTSDNVEKNKILIVSKDIKNHANFLLNEARESGRPSFYIDGPEAIDLNKRGVFIGNGEEKNPILRKKGLLADFLESAKNHPEQRPLLVINWQALSSKKRLALNTVLDEARAIGGEKIDDSIQIIGLSNSIPKDPSFLSRHDLRVESQVGLQEEKKSNAKDPALIDLEGFPDWRRQLFGRVILEGDKMIWEKSQFVEAVNAGQNVFEIANLSSQAAAELKYQFEKAKAAGEFIYHGHKIPLTQDLEIKCANESFNFVKFSEESRVAVASNVTFNQVPQDFTTINSHLFDRLLCDKEITAKGEYLERNGLIDQCAESADKTLKLFISSNLSDSQWYCLFNQALEKDVKLELCLAPKIDLPKQVKAATLNQEVQNTTSTACKIFVSNDPDQTLQLIPEQYAIIDVEDFTYQDLVEKISFTVDEDGFKNFTKTPSELLTSLRDGKKITLKGQFSPDLLQMLEPLLIGEEPEFAGLNQNLTLIIEDKKCLEGKVYAPLQWLAKSDYEVKNYPAVEKPTQTKFAYLESWKSSDDLQNSAAEALDFMDERKRKFFSALKSNASESNSMLRLVGHSGVGKSGLLKEVEGDEVIICRELSSFGKWVKDDPDQIGKTKILFLDESNIEDLHFTMFSPLKNGGNRRILHEGKFYQLSENHKVVFACNPAEYGGGRKVQKLFEDTDIPAIELRDFPRSYIYEKILKEAIYQGFSEEVKAKAGEKKFEIFCKPYIDEYRDTNSRKKSDKDANEETVRELQEKILVAITKELNGIDKKPNAPEIATASFISTAATHEVEESLNLALNIRQKQRSGDFPSKAVGLNGVLLEGDSGVGKSVLISAMLQHQGIKEKKFGDAAEESDWNYYKIDANLALEKKKEIIIKAFEEGNVVWIDEINSCVDDGLEKILNAVLTGDHPDGKDVKKVKPGFMLISSVNSAGLEGRSLISPALRHRTTMPRVKSLKEYSAEDLTKIINHWLPDDIEENLAENVSQYIATNFKTCLESKGGEVLNLRMLKDSLPEILPAYLELAKLGKELGERPLPLISQVSALNISSDATNFVSAMTSLAIEESKNIGAIKHLKEIGRDSNVKNLDKLRLFHSKFSDQAELEKSTKFDFSTTNDGATNELQKTISKSLQEAMIESKVTPLQAAAIIMSAIKNDGTANKALLEKDLNTLNDGQETFITTIMARKFSKLFQEKMRTSQIFTGNENATELVGMRLKRLTPNYALEILQNDSNPLIENKQREFKNLCEGIGIKNLLDLSKTASMTKDHGSGALLSQ